MDKGIEEVKRQYESLEGVAHQYAEEPIFDRSQVDGFAIAVNCPS